MPSGSVTSWLPALTVVAKMHPMAMNAPARIASMNVLRNGISALRTPRYSARDAISWGRSASMRISLMNDSVLA